MPWEGWIDGGGFVHVEDEPPPFPPFEGDPPEPTWTPEQRCEIARRHLMRTARDWERIPEAHQALMIAVDQIDHAEKSAK